MRRRLSRQPGASASLRRSLPAVPAARFLMTLPSDLRLRRCAGVSMVTGGPPSVAILVDGEVGLRRSRRDSLVRVPQARLRWPAARLSCAAAILISSVAAGASAAAGAASLGAGVSVTGFRACRSPAGASSGFSAAICSGSAGAVDDRLWLGWRARPPECSPVPDSPLPGSGDCRSLGSSAGGSTRSIASTGLAASLCGCAKMVSGGGRHDGTLANSSCAARSNAAAPSPNTRTDIDNTIAANRKRRPGSMDAGSAFAWCCEGLLSHWERGDHRTGRLRDAHRRRARIRPMQE